MNETIFLINYEEESKKKLEKKIENSKTIS
jgi:hypothetical protein